MVEEKSQMRETVVAILQKEGGGPKRVVSGKRGKGFNVIAIVRDKFGRVKQLVKAANIITNAGDLFYAQMCAGEVPTNAFANCILGTGAVAADKADDFADVTKIANTEKAPEAGYPKTNDLDADNTGAAVDSITYKYFWLGAAFNAASIVCAAIVVAAATGTDPILTRFLFDAPFAKAATDTLTVYVNHNSLGV